jgi:membrane associated rhomboid family serine protease
MAFGYVVWGVTGSATTEDAVAGLRIALGGNITTLTAVFGFLAVATSYFAFALNLQSTFRYDYRLHKVPAWLLSVGIPIGIFYAGAQSFISIVSFSGAVFGGITAIIVALLYIAVTRRKLVKEKPLKLPLSLAYVSIVVLGLGALYEMWTVVVK